VAELRPCYQTHGHSVHSNGSTFAELAQNPPQVRSPHLYVEPGPRPVTVEELCSDISHGLLVVDCDYVTMNRQLSTGVMNWGRMCEIKRGKIVSRVHYGGVVFTTAGLWKHLVGVGGAATVRNSTFEEWKGIPWHQGWYSVTAPAMRFHDVDVVSNARSVS
jgi:predicted Zn-dependent protease